MNYYILANREFHNITEVEDNHIKLKFTGNDLHCGDDYHTMAELYDHRGALFAALLNTFSEYLQGIEVWKSKLHSDGSMFEGGYFIAGAQTQSGQITYHMKIDEWWDKFNIPELENAPPYDGHTSKDVIDRLLKF